MRTSLSFFAFFFDSSSAFIVKETMSSNLADLRACHCCAERKMSWSWLKPLQLAMCSIDTIDVTLISRFFTLFVLVSFINERRYKSVNKTQANLSTYMLRSNTKHFLLDQPRKMKKTTGDRAFLAAAPTLWNALPDDLRTLDNLKSFKSQLKTHFFKLAYNLCS